VHIRRRFASADARVLVRPATTYRALSNVDTRPRPVARLLGWLLVLGCTVSLGVSGRFSLRLIADGAASFTFLPIFCVAGFSTAYFISRERPLPFARALDLFLTGLLPWLLWLIALGTICTIVPPRRLGPWIGPLEVSLAVPAIWSAVLDFHFFREVMARTPRAATWDLLVYRAVAWGGSTAYFLGIAIWYEVVPIVIRWIRP
jgi:hypothetical protein